MEHGGWAPYPGARERHERVLGQVPDGRVVGIGAICDLRTPRAEYSGSGSFSVSEFVRLEDGRWVLLHEERGFTHSPPMGPGVTPGSGHRDTHESILRHVLNTVLPDDDEEARLEAHPWQWLAGLAQARGLSVTAEGLQPLDYEVVLSVAVKRWVAEG